MSTLLEILTTDHDQDVIAILATLRWMKKVFTYIKADQFFKDYCPEIKSYNHKMRGFNGRGNPTDFTPEEKAQISAALKKLFKDLQK